jgi:hypothetical protein
LAYGKIPLTTTLNNLSNAEKRIFAEGAKLKLAFAPKLSSFALPKPNAPYQKKNT